MDISHTTTFTDDSGDSLVVSDDDHGNASIRTTDSAIVTFDADGLASLEEAVRDARYRLQGLRQPPPTSEPF
jgi:hypothetical protein